MPLLLLDYYNKLILKRPGITLLLVALVVTFFGYHTPAFRLDASADLLVLEHDEALYYYRSIRARYGSDDYLIATYTPVEELFSDAVLADLQALRDELMAMDRVESVTSLLDVPLIQSPPVTLAELNQEVPTLLSPQTNKTLARQEFLSSPLYRNLLISPDGKTTALQIHFRRDETWHRLLEQRNRLREKRLHSELSRQESEELASISRQFDAYSTRLQDQQHRDIAAIRSIMDRHREKAGLYLGGVLCMANYQSRGN